VPAANSLFDAAPDVPATVWLEYAHDDERDLPLRARDHHAVTWVPRKDGGQLLADTVCAELTGEDDAYYWLAWPTGAPDEVRVAFPNKDRRTSMG
jgi:NADPH-dependent ferric siderophore reductase